MFGLHKNREVRRLLVMRFSAMGDVAMTVPVLACVARQNPQLRITVLTRSRMAAFYEWLPSNVVVKGVNLDDYRGLAGLRRLYNYVSASGYDAVCDLHDVLRTKYLRTRFMMGGTRVVTIDKGRKDKHKLIHNGMSHSALRPMVERYADVFRALGLSVDLADYRPLDLNNESLVDVCRFSGRKSESERWVGIAPFAAHAQKIYPLAQMRRVAETLCERGCRVFLFGAGAAEAEVLSEWEREGIASVCGKLGGLRNEMLLMRMLDAMVSMDSANMHIASLMGVPVVSVWGATHPKAGFTGFGQSEENIIQIGDLPCRPCSIYGNHPCVFGDMRCMDIEPSVIVERVMATISSPFI